MKIHLPLKYLSAFLLFSMSSAHPMQWIKKQLPSKKVLYSCMHIPQGVSNLFEYVKENTIKKHPYLTATAIAIPVIVTALIAAKRYLGSTKAKVVNQVEKAPTEPVIAVLRDIENPQTPSLSPSSQHPVANQTRVKRLIDAFNDLRNNSTSLNEVRL